MGPGVFDLSFSQLQPESPLPDVVQAATGQHDGEQAQQQLLSPPPSALSLRECSLGDAGVAEVARSPWVCGATAVRSLSLRQNQVTAVGARTLLDALRASDSRDRLSSLELDFNPLGDAGVQPLPAYLKQRAARGGGGLEELSLRFCDIGPAGCRYISSALVKSAAAATAAADAAAPADPKDGGDKTSSPDSTGSGAESDAPAGGAKDAGDDGAGIVPSVPPPTSGVRRLLLAGNQRLGAAGARALASALKKDRSLQVLDLTRCKIGDEGARCLADALRSNSSLRELRLGYNDISADGASALASLLHAGSSALDSLELQGNHVGDAGATALANGLAGGGGKRGGRDAGSRRPTAAAGLRSLNLAGNGIGCAGGVALARALSGGGGCSLEELELAGNGLTLSAFQAAGAKKNSSLYKSAGGALSSLLNTFVDENYYSGGAPGGRDGGGGGGGAASPLGSFAVAPPRCAVAELGNALAGGGGGRGGGRGGRRAPVVKALGLGRTGLTDKDASRLAAALRARPSDSPLEEVEVGMNMLSAKAIEAVRQAVDSPTGPEADDFEAGSGRRRRRRQPQQQRQEQRRRQQSGIASGGVGGRSQSKPRGRGGRAVDDERAARGEVGNYIPPGGSVELGMFGRKLVSFGQERGDGKKLDVEVFGKRVRFERPSAAPSRSRSRSGVPPPPRASSPSPMGASEYEPWSDDGEVEVDFGEVSEAGATHGSDSWASSSSSSSSEEDEERGGEEERWNDADDSDRDRNDDNDGGTDGGESDEFIGRVKSRRGGGGQDGSSPSMGVRGGGGGGSGSGGEHPADRWTDCQRQRTAGGHGSDDGEWSAGFEPTERGQAENGGGDSNHPPGGAASAGEIEWEAGFEEEEHRQQQDAPSALGGCHGDRRTGSEPSVFQETGCGDDEVAGVGATRAAWARIEERAAGVVEGLETGTEDAEWCAGFGSLEGDGDGGGGVAAAASADKMEWDAGFGEYDLGSGFGTERDGGANRSKASL
eukprot:g9963.t1